MQVMPNLKICVSCVSYDSEEECDFSHELWQLKVKVL